MSWTMQQESAITDVRAWLKERGGPQVFRVFGYAGTGKTTIARDLATTVKKRVLFGAFTGKAALVLRRKGYVTVRGETVSLAEAVERFGVVNYQAVIRRLGLGWSIEQALSIANTRAA